MADLSDQLIVNDYAAGQGIPAHNATSSCWSR